jgi:drug/metabolite transporter (DMT)-like permease
MGLLAAATFATSSVLQQRAARQTPEEDSLSWRLIVDLVRRPKWLAGMGGNILGFVLQAVALAFAPVAFVEPVIGTEIVIALPIAARLRHVSLGRREWGGALCVVAGVASFLALCGAAGGNSDPALARWAMAGGPALLASGLAVLFARGPEGPKRASLLAVSAACAFAVVALLTQSFVQLLSSRGIPAVLETWQPYALLCVAPIGLTIAQSAFQAGPLAMSLPVVDSLEPILAVLLAAVAFGQNINLTPSHLTGEMAAGLLAVTGLFLLGRSPLVLSVYEQTEKEKKNRRKNKEPNEPSTAEAA